MADADSEAPGAVNDGTAEPQAADGGLGEPDHRLRGLYLFSGLKRAGDMHEHLSRLARAAKIKLELCEYDVLRNRKQDLTKTKLKKRILEQIS